MSDFPVASPKCGAAFMQRTFSSGIRQAGWARMNDAPDATFMAEYH
jgi:hypothetical protein